MIRPLLTTAAVCCLGALLLGCSCDKNKDMNNGNGGTPGLNNMNGNMNSSGAPNNSNASNSSTGSDSPNPANH